jgi:superfamily II DNA or RNA helicase
MEPPNQAAPRLHVGRSTTLVRALRDELRYCAAASFAVAFVMESGLDILEGDLRAAALRGANIRFLTSDFLGVTEPTALRRLLSIGPAAMVKCYEVGRESFHPKAYLFDRTDGSGRAFIGSANLSRNGLVAGIEWTWTVMEFDGGQPFPELRQRFTDLFESPLAKPLTPEWIDAYQARRVPQLLGVLETADDYAQPIQPRAVQALALQELDRLRADGEHRALVIAATGLGKTYLAAFDSLTFPRVLFVAHREELLRQARDAFASVRPRDSTGMVVAGNNELDRDLVFATVQSLARVISRDPRALERFEYVVIDEFHHAAAPTYIALLESLRPRFLLGLTATPYRGDNRDLYALCDGNVAYEIGLFAAIGLGWLAPFYYLGVADVIEYDDSLLNAARTGYDVARLTTVLSTEPRADLAIAHFRNHASKAALGFCVSIDHARYMEQVFLAAGIPALAVHSGPDSADRVKAVRNLTAGRVKILFVVDLFNEGVDIPCVDLVMFLRPTESMTVFVQQLGRGLRLHDGKDRLVVLDFIGNYRRAQYKLPFLTGIEDDSPEAIATALRMLSTDQRMSSLPESVKINLEPLALDRLRSVIEAPNSLRESLKAEFQRLQSELGRRPSLVDIERRARYPGRQYRISFSTWLSAIEACGGLTDRDRTLMGSKCLPFLAELEKTPMTRSYKMVVLDAMLASGRFPKSSSPDDALPASGRFQQSISPDDAMLASGQFQQSISPDDAMLRSGRFQPEISRDDTMLASARFQPSISLDDLTTHFRQHFSKARFSRDIVGTDIADVMHVAPAVLDDYLIANPINAWIGGNTNAPSPWFTYDAATRTFSYIGPTAADDAAFADAIRERVEWRLETYLSRPGPGRNTYKVIPNGNSACIMLGTPSGDGLPRSGGWKVIKINGAFRYAKFARIAINWIAAEPDGHNVISQELQELLGSDLLEFHRPQRVMIAAENDSDCWKISAV